MGQRLQRQQAETCHSKQDLRDERDWPWVWAIQDPEVLDWRCKVPAEDQRTVTALQANLPVSILPHLYLGDAKSARNMQRIRECGITHILNAAGPPARGKSEEYAADGIETLEFDAEDEEGYPMLEKHLESALAFIASAKNSGGKCLVHCVAGISRSGVLVAAVAMLSERMTVLETVAHCRRQRGNAYLWNHSFQWQLVALARSEGLLGPEPGERDSVVAQKPPTFVAVSKSAKPSAKDALAKLVG